MGACAAPGRSTNSARGRERWKPSFLLRNEIADSGRVLLFRALIRHGRDSMLRLLRQLSFPYLRTSWGRTALVVGGIATGVSLIVAIEVINASVLSDFRRTIDLIAGPAALEITLGVGEVGFPESTIDLVRPNPSVATVVPLVRGTIALADDPGEILQGSVGVDLMAEADLERYQITTSNRQEVLRTFADPGTILLTTDFAQRHALAVGSPVELSTPNGVETFHVRGLLDAKGLAAALGGRLAVMDLPAARNAAAPAGPAEPDRCGAPRRLRRRSRAGRASERPPPHAHRRPPRAARPRLRAHPGAPFKPC